MALPESDAVRFASALDDYDDVCVSDVGGSDELGFWVVVRDERFDVSYQIASHADYWDFVGAIVDHRQCLSLTPLAEVA
jgi:hypothetical protein